VYWLQASDQVSETAMKPRIQTTYLESVFDQQKFLLTIDGSLKVARELQSRYHYDTIAFCGVSGSALAFILSLCMGLPLLCVRKYNDSSHHVMSSSSHTEGNMDAGKYLIVDDLICSGKTVNYMLDTIASELPDAKCVAMMMYSSAEDRYFQYGYRSIPVYSSNEEWLKVKGSNEIIGVGV
jgi:adenine/guanine phosphoribosyltransferase-like PRPP-binding protein